MTKRVTVNQSCIVSCVHYKFIFGVLPFAITAAVLINLIIYFEHIFMVIGTSNNLSTFVELSLHICATYRSVLTSI